MEGPINVRRRSQDGSTLWETVWPQGHAKRAAAKGRGHHARTPRANDAGMTEQVVTRVTTSCGEGVWDAKRTIPWYVEPLFVPGEVEKEGSVGSLFVNAHLKSPCGHEEGGLEGVKQRGFPQVTAGDGMTLGPESMVDNSGLLCNMGTGCQFGSSRCC